MRITGAQNYREPRDSISHDLLTLVQAWEMLPFLIPNQLSEPLEYVSGIAPDLILFSGGDDLNESSKRDQNEFRLLQMAIDQGIPVFGICRGLQLLNSHFGGKTVKAEGHVASHHQVYINREFELFFGKKAIVNSFHNHVVDPASLAEEMRIVAKDDYGRIEALVHKTLPLMAVMWHPERSCPGPELKPVVEKLINEKVFWR